MGRWSRWSRIQEYEAQTEALIEAQRAVAEQNARSVVCSEFLGDELPPIASEHDRQERKF